MNGFPICPFVAKLAGKLVFAAGYSGQRLECFQVRTDHQGGLKLGTAKNLVQPSWLEEAEQSESSPDIVAMLQQQLQERERKCAKKSPPTQTTIF